MDRRIIDVKAIIEKKKQALLTEFETAERNLAERAAKRVKRLEDRIDSIERHTAREVQRLEAALSPNAPPYLVGEWLLMDSWSSDEGLLLIAGLEPAPRIAMMSRAERFSVEDRIKGQIDLNEMPNYLRTLEGLALWQDYSDYLEDWREIRFRILSGVQNKLRFARRIWETGTHPERPTATYFIKWAASKGIQVEWLKWAVSEGFFASESPHLRDGGQSLSGTISQSSLQKQIAVLALLLAEKSGKYKRGDRPNGNQIAEAVEELLEALPDARARGVGKSAIRASIKAGLDLLAE